MATLSAFKENILGGARPMSVLQLWAWMLGTCFPKPNFLVPGLGVPLARPSVARSLGPAKTPSPQHSQPRSLRSPLLMLGGRQQRMGR